jgi:hypothetical protein
MKIITLSVAMLLICICTNSQNLIGYKEDEIMKYMKENRHDMHYNNVVNSKFSYLKYSDSLDNQTILFFLSPESVCRSVRIICDVTMRSQMMKELDSHYLKNGENKWTDKRDGRKYLVEFMEGKWSCVISIEPEK